MTARKPRPATSIFVRPVRRQYAVKQTDIDYYVGLSEFGCESRKPAIGSSRRPSKPPPETPGPGAYDLPSSPKDTRIKHKMSNSRHAEIRCPMTTNIDYIDERSFPSVRPRTIGVRDGSTYFQPGDGAPCRYNAPSQLSKRSHKIADKYRPEKVEDVPGPQRYSPQFTALVSQGPAFPLSGPKFRDDWLVDTKNTPSPNQYNPSKPETKLPMYSIGFRSRRKKKTKQYTLFPIDQFIVKLEEDVTIEEAREYVIKHPVIKQVIRDIFENVWREKPESPRDFLRQYFKNQKAEMEAEESLDEDEIDLNRIIVHLAQNSQFLRRDYDHS